MKFLISIFTVLFCITTYANDGIFSYTLKDAKGEDYSFSKLKGKPFVLVNIATKCGFTGQLDDLEVVYNKYKDKGLIIVGIPSNDFMGQTPESNEKVAEFCRLKYGVKFPVMSKIVVKGDEMHPMIKDLLKIADVGSIKWNFEKFIFNKKGEFIDHFMSLTNPQDDKFIKAIEISLK